MATQGSARKRQQLTKGMEHMREAVVITEAPKTPDLGDDAYGVPASLAPVRRPPHRSHDPSNNQKRTDPFQFGSRYLEEGDDIFEHNAWDHVETDDAYKEFSELQFAKQREAPVSDFDKSKIIRVFECPYIEADIYFQKGSTPTLPNGGTSSTKRRKPTSSRIENGCNKNSLSSPI